MPSSTINPNVPAFKAPLLSAPIRAQFQAAINDINAILNAGILLAVNNLSDVENKAASRINLGLEIGTDIQAWSAVLDFLATKEISAVQGDSDKIQLASGGFTEGNIPEYDASGNLVDSGTAANHIFEVGGFQGGVPGASAIVFGWKFLSPVDFPNNFVGSSFVSITGTAATGSTVFTIYKNGSSIGTITVAASGTTGTIATTTTPNFAIGDILTVIAPGSPDATFANPSTGFLGSRV